MNTTEDKTMKKPPTPSERDAARIAALEREVAGWMDAAERFQRERDTSDAVLVEIEALLPPPEGDDQGIVSRVRRVVTARDVSRGMLAEIEAALPPAADGEQGLAQRVKGVVSRSSTAPGLSPRDRAILAPLLDTLDADLSSTDAGRALAAVRAVVGVGRA